MRRTQNNLIPQFHRETAGLVLPPTRSCGGAQIQKGKATGVKTTVAFSMLSSIGRLFVPKYNSLSKASALKVHAALRKYAATQV